MTLLLVPLAVVAQQPVCPEPPLGQAYWKACNVGGELTATRWLTDFSVDHHFKGRIMPFRRSPADLFGLFYPSPALPEGHPLAAYFANLAPLSLRALDTSTGTLEWPVAEEARQYAARIDMAWLPVDLEWQLPALVAGGYWRTPTSLQIVFWEGQRPKLSIVRPEHPRLGGEIHCVAITSEGLRVATTDAGEPQILVSYAGCP